MTDHSSDCYSQHLYAQRLNNAAASCIESGEHEKAVTVLVQALRLSRSSLPDGASCGHCPSYCSLDECIVYSEERATTLANKKARHCYEPIPKRRKTNATERVSYTPLAVNQSYDESDSTTGYTHRTPILVTPRIINEGIDMGPILSLIITFNLALSNHLKVLQVVSNKQEKDIATIERLGKVLRLYELAYQMEHEFYNPRNCSSVRFGMIVCNNLSQIHRMARNYSKQQKCLQHLLSILMFVVDWQRGQGTNNEDLVDADDADSDQQQQDSSEESDDNCATPEQQDDQPPQRQNTKRKRAFMNLDGFWRNISQFLLKDDCAKAA